MKFASLKGRPRGEALLKQLALKGRPTPELVRVRELAIGPGTAPDKANIAVLRMTFEFADGHYRAMFVDLADIQYLMLEEDTSIVTEHWVSRGIGGDVQENPPRTRQAAARTAPAGPPGVTAEFVGQVVGPLAETMGHAVAKLKRELAEQKRIAEGAVTRLAEANAEIGALKERTKLLEERKRR